MIQKHDTHILLQNENGPCPLLAAANCLLLKGAISLPPSIVVGQAGVVTIDQLINILAEKVLVGNHNPGKQEEQQSQQSQQEHHIQEVLTVFPSLQFGMDVNPKFTDGCSGVEYTLELNAFDLLHVELVHGWLIDPTDVEYDLIYLSSNQNLGEAGQAQAKAKARARAPQHQTYNQLINQVIKGNEASSVLDAMHASSQNKNNDNNDNNNNDNTLIDAMTATTTATTEETRQKHHELSTLATQGSLIHGFLERSSHQLTQYGLHSLYEHLQEGALVVFFRNNHFNTLTKHDGMLYLLVTDLGYATVDIMWEKLDVIDGDTEYMTADFVRPPPMPHHMNAAVSTCTGEQLVANNVQSQADYHLALQLSRETTTNNAAVSTGAAVNTGIRGGNVNGGRNGNANVAPVESNTGASTPGAVAVREDQDVQAALRASLQEYQQLTLSSSSPVTIPSAQPSPQHAAASGVPATAPPTVAAVGVQMTCEETDRLLAMQLERESMPANMDDQASHRLAMELHRKDQEERRQRVDRPAGPPGRLPTTPPPPRQSLFAKKDNCVLM